MKTKIVSLRVSPLELAKARDGLLNRGIEPSQIDTLSAIVRLTFYYGIMQTCTDPKEIASQESINHIEQMISSNKRTRQINLNDLE